MIEFSTSSIDRLLNSEELPEVKMLYLICFKTTVPQIYGTLKITNQDVSSFYLNKGE